MRVLYSIICAGLTVLANIGCGGNQPAPLTPIQPPVVLPTPPVSVNRTDLPINWFEVKGDNWSYGLPLDFSPVLAKPDGSLALHYSINKQLTITYTNYTTTSEDLRFIVLNEYIIPYVNSGREVLAVKENNHGDFLIIAFQVLDTLKTDGKRDGALSFFALKNKTLHHMDCSAESTILKNNADICFKIIDTLKLQ